MGTFTYNGGIPDAPNNPSVDQPKMKTNTDSINGIIGVDHVGFNVSTVPPTGGYHTIIHSVLQGSDPAQIANIGQLYIKNYTPPGGSTDTQLFFKTGAGGTSQLTGNKALNNGYQWLGGVLIQWGQVTSTASTFQTLTFSTNNIPFPTNCFTVITQPYGAGTPSGSQATVQIRKSTVSNTSFEWAFITNGSNWTGFYWVAIGN